MEESGTQAPPVGAAPGEWRAVRFGERPTAGAYPRLVLTPVPADGAGVRPGGARTWNAAHGRGAAWRAPAAAWGPGVPGTPGAVWAVAAGLAVLVIIEALGRRASAPRGLTAVCSAAAFAVAVAPGLTAAACARRRSETARTGAREPEAAAPAG
ncbi:hypothetical protein ACFYTC_28065 [Actinomadura nitritigenes]|uniref:hypothetical protein n=1 Tax=Actinomadura nitritigenes TaxID=134602 RepID=UPI00368DAE27